MVRPHLDSVQRRKSTSNLGSAISKRIELAQCPPNPQLGLLKNHSSWPYSRRWRSEPDEWLTLWSAILANVWVTECLMPLAGRSLQGRTSAACMNQWHLLLRSHQIKALSRPGWSEDEILRLSISRRVAEAQIWIWLFTKSHIRGSASSVDYSLLKTMDVHAHLVVSLTSIVGRLKVGLIWSVQTGMNSKLWPSSLKPLLILSLLSKSS